MRSPRRTPLSRPRERISASEQRQHAVIIASGAHPAIAAISWSHGPKIEITIQSVASWVERCRTGYALVMVGFLYNYRFEVMEILLWVRVYQGELHYK